MIPCTIKIIASFTTGWRHMPTRTLRRGRVCRLFVVYVSAGPNLGGCRPRHCHAWIQQPTAFCSAQTSAYTTEAEGVVPLRQQLKAEAKVKQTAKLNSIPKHSSESQKKLDDWELTVGIEIHAQLNTARKLFSRRHSVYVEHVRLNVR